MTVASTSMARAERGFTLIELVAVMLVAGVLMAIAGSTMLNTKDTATSPDAIVAGHSLQKAVEGFRRDREGRAPSRGTDWPTANKGPVDGDAARPYMPAKLRTTSDAAPSSWPDNVALTVVATRGTTRHVIPTRPSGTSNSPQYRPAGSTLSVEYEALLPSASPTASTELYRITIRQRSKVLCVLTNDPTAGGETC